MWTIQRKSQNFHTGNENIQNQPVGRTTDVINVNKLKETEQGEYENDNLQTWTFLMAISCHLDENGSPPHMKNNKNQKKKKKKTSKVKIDRYDVNWQKEKVCDL